MGEEEEHNSKGRGPLLLVTSFLLLVVALLIIVLRGILVAIGWPPITTNIISNTNINRATPIYTSNIDNIISNKRGFPPISIHNINITSRLEELKCGENRNHGKFKIYFLMVEL